MHAGMHAIQGRKQKKRDYRRMWNVRIGAGARELGLSYSVLIGKLARQKIALNRKMLAELAFTKPEIFKKIVESVKG